MHVYQAACWPVTRSLVLNPDNPPKRIIIDEVTHYAYGQTEDKSIELWVAGKAGWYNIISPAKGFTPTYNRMVQAIDMLYFLVDKHQQGKRQINPSFRSLCEQVSLSIVEYMLYKPSPNMHPPLVHLPHIWLMWDSRTVCWGLCDTRYLLASVHDSRGCRCGMEEDERLRPSASPISCK